MRKWHAFKASARAPLRLETNVTLRELTTKTPHPFSKTNRTVPSILLVFIPKYTLDLNKRLTKMFAKHLELLTYQSSTMRNLREMIIISSTWHCSSNLLITLLCYFSTEKNAPHPPPANQVTKLHPPPPAKKRNPFLFRVTFASTHNPDWC